MAVVRQRCTLCLTRVPGTPEKVSPFGTFPLLFLGGIIGQWVTLF